MVEVQRGGTFQRNTYDAAGLRVIRRGQQGETIFASSFFDLESGTQGVKHIFAGDTRVASVLARYDAPTTGGGKNPPADTAPLPPKKPGTAYFFHQDHLGSTSVLTNERGDVHEHLQYFPDGEVWIDHAPQQPVNGYLFSGKPFDPETGFSDLGQRFYDPKTSLFLGVDSAFANDAGTSVGRPTHLAVSAYAAQSPLAQVDPDGNSPLLICAFGPVAVACAGAAAIGGAILVAAVINQRTTTTTADPYPVPHEWDTPGPTTLDPVPQTLNDDPVAREVPIPLVRTVPRVEPKARPRQAKQPFTYVTYTKENRTTGETYVGHAGGVGTPRDVVDARDRHHHKTREGFGAAQLDRFAVATQEREGRHADPAYWAIRGREQQLTDSFGGAWTDVGRGGPHILNPGETSRSGNTIRPVRKLNPFGRLYHWAANLYFGEKARYTGF